MPGYLLERGQVRKGTVDEYTKKKGDVNRSYTAKVRVSIKGGDVKQKITRRVGGLFTNSLYNVTLFF